MSLREPGSYLSSVLARGNKRVYGTHELAADKATAERAVRDECDAELLARVPDPDLRVFDIERKRCVLELRSRDRVDFTCPP